MMTEDIVRSNFELLGQRVVYDNKANAKPENLQMVPPTYDEQPLIVIDGISYVVEKDVTLDDEGKFIIVEM